MLCFPITPPAPDRMILSRFREWNERETVCSWFVSDAQVPDKLQGVGTWMFSLSLTRAPSFGFPLLAALYPLQPSL